MAGRREERSSPRRESERRRDEVYVYERERREISVTKRPFASCLLMMIIRGTGTHMRVSLWEHDSLHWWWWVRTESSSHETRRR